MRLVLEAHGHLLELAEALDVDLLMGVDKNVAHGRVLEQRLDRPEPGQLVENLGGEILELARVQQYALGAHIIRNDLGDLCAQLLPREALQHGKIEVVDELTVQADLGFQQLLLDQLVVFRRELGEPAFHRRGLARNPGMRPFITAEFIVAARQKSI